MKTVNPAIRLIVNLSKTQTILTHRFNIGLGGLGFNEFLIMLHLYQAENQKMRRVDLAEKIGITASGITRLLLPMEKTYLIKSGPIEQDARVRFVMLTLAGKQKLIEGIERMDLLINEIIPKNKIKDINILSELLVDIGGRALMT
jgi:DNA-binding MarR family transcriptional regulator